MKKKPIRIITSLLYGEKFVAVFRAHNYERLGRMELSFDKLLNDRSSGYVMFDSGKEYNVHAIKENGNAFGWSMLSFSEEIGKTIEHPCGTARKLWKGLQEMGFEVL